MLQANEDLAMSMIQAIFDLKKQGREDLKLKSWNFSFPVFML